MKNRSFIVSHQIQFLNAAGSKSVMTEYFNHSMSRGHRRSLINGCIALKFPRSQKSWHKTRFTKGGGGGCGLDTT